MPRSAAYVSLIANTGRAAVTTVITHTAPMRRLTALAAVVGLIAAAVLASPAAAATVTVTALSASVSRSGAVTVTSTVKASPAVTAAEFGVCVRRNGNQDLPKRTRVLLTTDDTEFTATKTFTPGTYLYFTCWRIGQTWTNGPTKSFTVPAVSDVLFEDSFTGPAGSYDHGKWGEWSAATYNGSAGYGNIKAGDRALLDGAGHLSIPATPDTGTSVSTKDDFTFTYGTITARMLVPTEAGYWPAFWTLNNRPDGRDKLPIGEVDVHESYTGLANYYHVATHHYSDQSWSGVQDPACGRDRVFGEWHDYSAKVEPGQVSFYFDGVMCGTYATKDEANGRPYALGPDTTRPNWLILTLAVGGAGGQQDGKAVAPATLLVDRVSVTAI